MPMVTLRPTGAFHVGQDTGSERQKVHAYIPSDTLFSALVVAWAHMGKADDIVKQFGASPPFTLSSAFPCLMARGEQPRVLVRLLPLPQVNLPGDDVLPAKKKKRIRWVSWGVFERLCSAQPLDGETADENLVQGKTVWLLKQERQDILQAWGRDADSTPWWTVGTVPRVSLDRITNASNLFHVGRVTFTEGLGLWFALQGGDGQAVPTLKPDLQAALALLSDAGLGGLRSIGHGAFQWSWNDDTLPSAAPPSGYAVTLARYAPKDKDEVARTLQVRGASYQLVTVAGWCEDDTLHPWRRKRLRLVSEGGVIGYEGGTAGGLVDVKPTGAPQARFGTRGVYRYGYAFPVSVSRKALREVPDE
jgi:CRISPR-associated protein Csm4